MSTSKSLKKDILIFTITSEKKGGGIKKLAKASTSRRQEMIDIITSSTDMKKLFQDLIKAQQPTINVSKLKRLGRTRQQIDQIIDDNSISIMIHSCCYTI